MLQTCFFAMVYPSFGILGRLIPRLAAWSIYRPVRAGLPCVYC